MIEQLWKLTPIKAGNHYEQIVVSEIVPRKKERGGDYWYPFAIFFVDCFYKKEWDDNIYDQLREGKTVFIDVKMAITSQVNLPG